MRRYSAAMVGAVGMIGTVGIHGASASVAPGCWAGQAGLYNQPNYSGHCYGFADRNYSLLAYSTLRDNMRSGWNGGTGGEDAVVYQYTNFEGYTTCYPFNRTGKTYSSPRWAHSNDWLHAC